MPEKQERSLNRRRFLEVAGSATAGALAGCTDLTQQRFEAKPYGLTEQDQVGTFLGEVVRTSKSIRREPEAGPISGEITIVNEVSGYTRGNAVSQALGESEGVIAEYHGDVASPPDGKILSLMERWIRRVNGTQSVGSAVVGPANKLGLDEANPGSLETSRGEPVTVPGDQVSLVIPAQAREDSVSLNEMMAL